MYIIKKIKNTINGDYMNLNIRSDIKEKLKEENINSLKKVIDDSIDKEELILPGLGVIFEIIWKNINDSEKNNLVKVFIDNIKK